MDVLSRGDLLPKIVEAYSRPTRIVRGKDIIADIKVPNFSRCIIYIISVILLFLPLVFSSYLTLSLWTVYVCCSNFLSWNWNLRIKGFFFLCLRKMKTSKCYYMSPASMIPILYYLNSGYWWDSDAVPRHTLSTDLCEGTIAAPPLLRTRVMN